MGLFALHKPRKCQMQQEVLLQSDNHYDEWKCLIKGADSQLFHRSADIQQMLSKVSALALVQSPRAC